MITSAITAAIVAVLTFLGIPPGPYIAGIWVAVKVVVVLVVGYISWRMVKKKQAAASESGPESEPPGPPA